MTAPVTMHAPGDVLVENVDVPDAMIEAALAALEAGRMRASPFDGGPLGGMPPAFLSLDEELLPEGPDRDPHAAAPLIAFLSDDHAPTRAEGMVEAAIASLRGRPVPATEIAHLRALLAHAHVVRDGRDDDRIVANAAPSPWHGGGSGSLDTLSRERTRERLDPEFALRMPTAARLSIAHVGGSEAIALSAITALGETNGDAMDRLRILRDVDARPIGSVPSRLASEPAR